MKVLYTCLVFIESMLLRPLLLLLPLVFSSACQFWQREPVPYNQKVDLVFPRMQSSSAISLSSSSSATTSLSSSRARSVLIDVPFATQAPLRNWDSIHEETCEEISLILVDYYLRGLAITPSKAEEEIQKFLAWQHAQPSYADDTDMETTASFARAYFGRKATVTHSPSILDIEHALLAGHPVIVPTAGRILDNPFYSGLGPWYHMVVIVGFDEDNFIVHDVGTRRGERYSYNKSHLFESIHDWTGVKENISQGGKAMLVLEPL